MNDHPAWRSPLRTIRDAVTLTTRINPLREGAFRVLDAVQSAPPAVQIQSIFLAGTVMALAIGLEPHDLVSRAKRQLPDADAFSDQVRALGDYARGELRR